ncbi:MAG: hypothetical protein AAGJ83_00615, partial [Planctomycetota bacterium]
MLQLLRHDGTRRCENARFRRRVLETLESRRLLAVVAFDESTHGDLSDSPAANVFTLDSSGTNSWSGTLSDGVDLSDGFQVALAPGTSVTDIRLAYVDVDEATDPDTDVRFDGSTLFDHAVMGTESVNAGSFSTLNPTLPIQNTQLVNEVLTDILVSGTAVVPSGQWSIEIDTVDVNLAPRLISNGSISLDENLSEIIDLEVEDDEDAEGSGLTYGIIGGADASLFAINTVTGVVSFLAAPDFETPNDSDADNVYEALVEVSDSGMETDVLSLIVEIQDVNEAPMADAGGPYFIDAGKSLTLDASGSSDPDTGDSLTFHWDLDQDGDDDIVTSDSMTTVDWLNVIDLLQVGTQTIDLTVKDLGGLEASSTADVTISDQFMFSPASDMVDDTYTLIIADSDLRVVDSENQALLSRVPLAEISTIDVLGGSDLDTLTIDFSGGNFQIPISFDGGLPEAPSSGDSLILAGGFASSVEHTFEDAASGTVGI